MTLIVAAVGIVLAFAAIVAWASAWKTLDWLADAEDLIERTRDGGSSSTYMELEGYQRRTPRRSPS